MGEERKETNNPIDPRIHQLLITAAAIAISKEFQPVIPKPTLGRAFKEKDLGNPFHDIKPYHTLGMKAPQSGKRQK